MVKKRNPPNRKRTKSTPVKRVVRITSNPFLNFFLSVCKLKGNQTVEKIARNAAVEWRKMNYLDKTPYYLLADEAKKRKKRSFKKKGNVEEYRYSDWDSPLVIVPRKRMDGVPFQIKSDTELDEAREKPAAVQRRRKSEGAKRKRSFSSDESDTVLTSDVEGVDYLIENSEKDLKRRKFWEDALSDSSFGLSTSASGDGTSEGLPTESSAVFGVDAKGFHRTHDFYQ